MNLNDYPIREARAHEPSVRIVDGWAVMPSAQWVLYARLSGAFFVALTQIAERPQLAEEIAGEVLALVESSDVLAATDEPPRPFHDV